jgi:hypothetical protein
VRRSEVFDGNVVEGTTLAGMLTCLRAPAGALVVMDRGIATEENLHWLREQGYRYLVVSRERQRQFDANQASDLQTAGGECVSVQRVEDRDSKEVRLYCYSPGRARKEEGISQRFAERFEAALQALADGLSRPRTTKKIDKLWERIGRLKEPWCRAALSDRDHPRRQWRERAGHPLAAPTHRRHHADPSRGLLPAQQRTHLGRRATVADL